MLRMGRIFLPALLLWPVTALAQGDPARGIIDNSSGRCDFSAGRIDATCLNLVIANAVEVVFAFAGVICLLNIIIAGYQIAIGNVTGEGDTGGKTRLKNALIGFFFTAATFGIINAALDAVTP